MIGVLTADTPEPGESLLDSSTVPSPAAREANDRGVCCPLCGSAVVPTDSINPEALTRAYKRLHQVDVAHLMHDVKEIQFCECPNVDFGRSHLRSRETGTSTRIWQKG